MHHVDVRTIVTLVGIALLVQMAPAGATAPGGKVNVGGVSKIDQMNSSPNEFWNLNENDGRRLLVLFGTGSVQIPQQSSGALQRFASYLREHPEATAHIFGHSDVVDSRLRKDDLGQRRADAVRTYLINSYGIDGERLIAEGYGQVTESAHDTSDSARQMNRRVFAIIQNPSRS